MKYLDCEWKSFLSFVNKHDFHSEHFSNLLTTTQKMKFSIKNFFSKCDQIRSFLRICSRLLKKSLMESLIFCAVQFVGILLSNLRSEMVL